MTPGQLIDLLEKAGMLKEESPGVLGWHPTMQKAERFAALVAAAERNKLAQWMIDHSYATGHGDTTEDLLEELDWQITESWSKVVMASVEAEREACAKVCESRATPGTGSVAILNGAADAIRARGETK
jgi:hypothetical protein